MIEAITLEIFLERWAGEERQRRDVAGTLVALADACRTIGGRIAKGALPGGFTAVSNMVALGQANTAIDRQANDLIVETLSGAPVASMASCLLTEPMAISKSGTVLVAISPLDGSAGIDANAPMGTVFSILPAPEDAGDEADASHFLQPGVAQLAAGFAVYGPRTSLVLSVGSGTHVFTLDADTQCFLATGRAVDVPPMAREYAINAANYRHWDEAIRVYVDDCLKGSDGLRAFDFNMRWIGSPVAEIYRIFMRGGIYLYPADTREGYSQGRFRQIFEANPISMIVEQAGGAASTGTERILELTPSELHQRVPIIVGSRKEVDYVVRLHSDPYAHGERSPLFGRRGLFRN